MACALTAWMARHMRVMCVVGAWLQGRRRWTQSESPGATVTVSGRWWPGMRVLGRVLGRRWGIAWAARLRESWGRGGG